MSNSQHPLDDKLLLGRYRVMRLLGEGGMGTVHLARVEGAEGFTRPVVVKRMKRDIRTSEEGHRLFIREAKILSKLQHPAIVGISDFGVEDGAHIMVLDYVHGYTLSPWLEYRQRHALSLPVDICLFIVRRILAALHYAHHFDTEEGREIEIVHRDVSPDNVLLSNKGYVHLLDFGIASMRGPHAGGTTRAGSFRGKLCYAAPETVQGQPATPRSDQYSAAVVLLELLTLRTPFAADSIAETFLRMVNEVPEPASKFRADVSHELDEVIGRALAKEPAARFDSAAAFARELRRLQADDDEDVAERLQALIREDFERLPQELGIEGLKSREAALAKILSIVPPAVAGRAAYELPTLFDGTARAFAPDEASRYEQAGLAEPSSAAAGVPASSAASRGAQSEPAVVAPSSPRGDTERQLRGLMLAVILVGGLIAVGLGAAVALLARSGPAEPVVVVGEERVAEPFAAPPAPATVAAAGASAGDSVTESTASLVTSASAALLEASPALPTSAPSQRRGGAPAQGSELGRAVQKQSEAFQACFSKHLASWDRSAPEAILHFTIAPTGGSARVGVEPPAVKASPLGACLEGAARRVQFPPQSEPVAFRMPVRARITRVNGTR